MTVSYSTNPDQAFTLREQLRLFAFDLSPLPAPDVILRVRSELSKRQRLAVLLEGELNFHGENSGYASHDLHAFAAKFPPQLPRAFIRGLTNPNDIVLDPMMGSGTTVVESLLESRQGIGFDIDPLALRLCYAKTTRIDVAEMRDISTRVISKANSLLEERLTIDNFFATQFDEQTKEFINYWFYPATQRQLASLILAIREVENEIIRRFLELAFSSVIITKSGGVSKARDLAHSRPHLDETKVPKNAIDQFAARLRKNLASIAELNSKNGSAGLIGSDARLMPLADSSIDLIVTSPPYANAIDYMRAHKFSLVWFGKSVKDLSELRSKYIGSERVGNTPSLLLGDRAESIIRKLSERDHSKAAVLKKYFIEMKTVLSEMYRVLRSDSAAIVVVGTSTMRSIDVETHLCLAEIAANVGFDVVGVVQRQLDRNKRMMPARFGKKTDSMIEQRMHDEYVIGLLKPDPINSAVGDEHAIA